MSEFLRNQVMSIMQAHRGKQNVLLRRDLLAHLQLFKPKMTDREMRDLYASLPLCSCDAGLFLPQTVEEVREFREYLKRAWGPIVAHRRVATIIAFYPKLDPTEWRQEKLPLPGMENEGAMP